jgi:hypothetical protein
MGVTTEALGAIQHEKPWKDLATHVVLCMLEVCDAKQCVSTNLRS